jgi:hypothetical protein
VIKLNIETRDDKLSKLGAKLYSVPDTGADGSVWETITDNAAAKVIAEALAIVQTPAVCSRAADNYFLSMPGKRSLTEIVTGDRIVVWISVCPHGDWSAETVGMHITLGKAPIRWGHWATAATIVHELAHVNGCSDEARPENGLRHAGLGAHFVLANTLPYHPGTRSKKR